MCCRFFSNILHAYLCLCRHSRNTFKRLHCNKESGAKPALEAWIKGSGIDGSKEALAQANMLAQIGEYYGKYLSYELVKSNKISKNTNVYLVVINYEKGSVFAKFFTYVTPNGKEVMQTFNFNTNADLVWPSNAIYGS